MSTAEQSKNCVIDARVSTDKQLAGHGLDDQERVCEVFAYGRNWNIVKIFSKSHSGRKDERADFEEVIEYIKKYQSGTKKIHYYVVKSIDRFTRNGHITYGEMKSRLGALGVQLIDVYGIIQPEQNTLAHLGESYDWSVYSPSETAELMEATRGKADVRDTLTRMIGAEIGLTQEGYSMRCPNDGYLNTKEIIDGREMSVLIRDEDRAYFYAMIFRQRALGTLSDKEIVNKVNAAGYFSKPRKIWKKSGKKKYVIGHTEPKQMTVKQLQKLVLKPMYAGVKLEKWNHNHAVFAVFATGEKPIVSIEEFNKANRGKVYIKLDASGKPIILYDFADTKKVRARKKYHPDYKYDKMCHCESCHKPLKNSGRGNKSKSGKYYQGYHCDRADGCKKVTGRIPKDVLEKKIKKLLNRVVFSDDFANKLESRLMKKYRQREQEVLKQSIKVGENVTSLKKRQDALFQDFHTSTSLIVKKRIEKEIEDLELSIEKATEERDKIEIEERDIKAFVRYAKDLVEHPAKMLENNRDPYKQRALFDLVFEEPLTYSQVVNGTPKLSFIFKLSGTQKGAKSPKVSSINNSFFIGKQYELEHFSIMSFATFN